MYPLASDVSALVAQMGASDLGDMSFVLDAAIQRFEALTGYQFVAESVDSEATYDPPSLVSGFVLELPCGYVSVSAVEINGAALTATEYDLLPLNAAYYRRPYTELRFRSHPGSAPASITVTGRRGYSVECPADVKLAITRDAACYALTGTALGLVDASKLKQGPVEIDTGGMSRLVSWRTDYEATVTRYRRV